MKKLIVGRRWKRYLAARSRSQRKANARFARHRRIRAVDASRHPHPKHFKKTVGVTGPEVFSLVQNPENTIAFFQELQSVAQRRNVFVNLSEVKTITPDAIAGLLAAIHQCRTTGTRISGNAPSEQGAQQVLNDSGFRTYVRNSPNYAYPAQMGKIMKRQRSGETFQDRFDQRLARDLIEFATLKLTGAAGPHPPSFSVFCEAMLNTLNHAASPGESHERWWASVYFDSRRGRACFTFIDQGVGIFRSHQLTLALKLLTGLRLLNRAELLRRIFEGKIPSTTRLPGRGNGIPGMYDHCKAGRIKEFTVISNDVCGNAETDTYTVLSNAFAGTVLYWEV